MEVYKAELYEPRFVLRACRTLYDGGEKEMDAVWPCTVTSHTEPSTHQTARVVLEVTQASCGYVLVLPKFYITIFLL